MLIFIGVDLVTGIQDNLESGFIYTSLANQTLVAIRMFCGILGLSLLVPFGYVLNVGRRQRRGDYSKEEYLAMQEKTFIFRQKASTLMLAWKLLSALSGCGFIATLFIWSGEAVRGGALQTTLMGDGALMVSACTLAMACVAGIAGASKGGTATPL